MRGQALERPFRRYLIPRKISAEATTRPTMSAPYAVTLPCMSLNASSTGSAGVADAEPAKARPDTTARPTMPVRTESRAAPALTRFCMVLPTFDVGHQRVAPVTDGP